MNWPNVSLEAGPPKSVCSEPCLQGHVKSFTVRLKSFLRFISRIFFVRKRIILTHFPDEDEL